MSSDDTTPPAESRPLQFDIAEPTGAAGAATTLACTLCRAEISSSYFEANGSIVCASCRAMLHAQLTGGSASARFGKALGFGLVGATAGWALCFAILKLTGYQVGLVAMLVGFVVGWAVRRGSEGRGGRAYQILAVGLTYLAIISTYIPVIVTHARETIPAVAADSASRAETPDSVAVAAAAATAEQQGAPVESPPSDATAERGRKWPWRLDVLVGVAALLWLAAKMPVLVGSQNIVWMFVIAIALYEAWRQNQKLELVVTGPYTVRAKGPGASGAEPPRG